MQRLESGKYGLYYHDVCACCKHGFDYGKVKFREKFQKYLCPGCFKFLQNSSNPSEDETIRNINLYTTKTIRELSSSRKKHY